MDILKQEALKNFTLDKMLACTGCCQTIRTYTFTDTTIYIFLTWQCIIFSFYLFLHIILKERREDIIEYYKQNDRFSYLIGLKKNLKGEDSSASLSDSSSSDEESEGSEETGDTGETGESIGEDCKRNRKTKEVDVPELPIEKEDHHFYNCKFSTILIAEEEVPVFVGSKHTIDKISEVICHDKSTEMKSFDHDDIPQEKMDKNILRDMFNCLNGMNPDPGSLQTFVCGIASTYIDKVDGELNQEIDNLNQRRCKAQSVLRNGEQSFILKVKPQALLE
jgi:hypothetical protein